MEQNEQMYYLRANGEIILSVCIIKDMERKGTYHRGMAIKSITDQNNKSEGRKRALGRARRAMRKGKSSSTIRTIRVLDRMNEVGITDVDFMTFKSAFCCELTKFEEDLMEAMEERMEKDA